MSLNAFLHPRNPYRAARPDFKTLAAEETEFRKVAKTELSGKVSLDFRDRESVRVLTEVLLRRDFGLNVRIPPGVLVPTLPLRLNYLLWVQDLVEGSNGVANSDVIGLDVGVGPACVYPLLARKHLGWKMAGTEIDVQSLSAAAQNVDENGLSGEIKLFKQSSGDERIFKCLDDIGRVTFTMCNPPFFKEEPDEANVGEDGDGGAKGDRSPRSPLGFDAPAGSEHEMKTKGGEVEFVSRMIKESSAGDSAATIFTCMLGHKSSIKPVKRVLQDLEKSSVGSKLKFVFTEFCQGGTMRWGVAWSLSEGVSLPELSQLKKRQEEKKQHKPYTFTMEEDGGRDCKSMFALMKEWLEEADFVIKAGKIEEERFSFTMKTEHQHYKNLRRLRREKLRAEAEKAAKDAAMAAQECDEPSAKRSRLEEEEPMVTDDTNPPKEEKKALKAEDVQLCCKVVAQKAGPGKYAADVSFIYGAAGRDGMYQAVQYIKNKSQSCCNAKS